MIYIEKKPSQEARFALLSFVKKQKQAELTPHYKDFGHQNGKKEVQNSLLQEQGYICAYCMQRIETAEKIEHWDGQAKNALKTLEYENMLAVCGGELEHFGKKIEHCDTQRSKLQSKGKGDLTLNPTDKSMMAEIHYTKNGKIYYKSLLETEYDEKCKKINSDIDNTLNINHLSLMDNRRRAYESAKKTLEIAAKRKSYDSMKAKLLAEWEAKHLDAATGEYKYKPFCGMLIYHLKK